MSSPRNISAASSGGGWRGSASGSHVTGAAAATVTILRGQSSVLYTFYPPLQAHPLFYIGATMIVVGSWLWGGVLIASHRAWRRASSAGCDSAGHARHADGGDRLVPGDGRPRGGNAGHPDPVVARARRDRRSARGAHLLLVVRSSAGVLLAAAGLRVVVHGAAASRRRPALQRFAGADGVHPVRACSRRPSASTTSSRIRASAPAGSWPTPSRPTP